MPSHAVYVNVQIFVPEQTGYAPGTPADTVKFLLQLSITVGGTGAVALAAQATVDDPPAGMVTTGGLMLYVYTQFTGIPSQPVYTKVHVFVPAHGGSALGTPADGVTGLPQSSNTDGGVGRTARAAHATVDEPGAGKVKVDAGIVYV